MRSEVDAFGDRIYVVVGVIYDKNGKVLIQERRPGTPKAGKWEFPGGKRELGETPTQALSRELAEELAIDTVDLHPLTAIAYDYAHAKVWLDTYIVTKFNGTPRGREGQKIAWTDIPGVLNYDVLEAVPPIVEALQARTE